MGFFSKLFKIASGRKFAFTEDEDEEIVYDREGIDFHDQTQRTRYIAECLEQVAEGSREMESRDVRLILWQGRLRPTKAI